MAIMVMYIDLRNSRSEYKKSTSEWTPGLKAFDAIASSLGNHVARRVEQDLLSNIARMKNHDSSSNNYLMVSLATENQPEENSGVGGVGSLDWIVPDQAIISIIYEDKNTTETQVEESTDWMLQNGLFD